MSSHLSRRHVLRGLLNGAAVTVAMPTLEGMLNSNGTAFAAGAPLPRTFGVWFFGDGVRPEQWVPKTNGANWQASPELAPLIDAGFRDYLSVISGLDAMGDPYVHAGPASAVLTGTGLDHAPGDNGTPQGPSIDVMIADQLRAGAPFKTIETGVYSFLGNGSAYRALSHRGPDAPNYPEIDPVKVYARLFGAGAPGANAGEAQGGPTIVDAVVKHRRSALDAVLSDCKSFQKTLSASDNMRVQQYCESLRSLETRLAATPPMSSISCAKPTLDPAVGNGAGGGKVYDNSNEVLFAEINKAHSQLLAMAIACDLTHVFTHCYTNPAAHWWFKYEDWNESFHVLTHDEGGQQPKVHAGVVLTMKRLADTLTIFKNTPLGAGNVLDQLAMMVTSDCSIGQNHSPKDMPFLVIGKAGGKLRGNVHKRFTGGSVTQATLTVARAAGATLAEFGVGPQKTASEVTEVFSP